MRFSYISCPINSDSPVLPKQPNTSISSTSQPIPTMRTIETQSCQTRSIHYPDSNSSIRYTDSTQLHSMQKKESRGSVTLKMPFTCSDWGP